MSITVRLAWRNLWRRRRRTWLTVGAMIFSNILLVFMISIQVGMYSLMIDNTLRAQTGHLQVQAPGYKDEQKIRQIVPEVEQLAGRVRETLHSDDVAPRAASFALISSAERSFGVQIVGVDPRFEERISSLPGLIQEGRYFDDGSSTEIVVGRVLARNLQAGVGDELTLLGSGMDGSFAAAVATIVGIFDSGMPDVDRMMAQVPLGFFQETFAMGTAGHAVAVLAPDLLQVPAMREKVRAVLPRDEGLVVHTWDVLLPGLKQAIQTDLASAWYMYGVLIVLVAFSVLNTQLMSVLERTREFGIVIALGVTPGRLGRLILLETTLMGLLGLVLGVVLGGVLVAWFGQVGFTYPGLEEMASKFNLPGRLYPQVSLIGLFVGPVFVLIASVVASLYPALRLRRLEPVEAMRAA